MAVFQLPVRCSSQVNAYSLQLRIMCVRMRAIQSRAGPISKRDIYPDTTHLGYCGQKFKVQMCARHATWACVRSSVHAV